MKTQHILSAGLLVSLVAVSHADWAGPYRSVNFPRNTIAGQEANGRPLFIAQCRLTPAALATASDHAQRPQGNEWHIGKAGVHLRGFVAIPYAGKEWDVSHCQNGEFFVYTQGTANERWQAVAPPYGLSPGSVPIAGNNTLEKQSICRASFSGAVVPGKYVPADGRCHIGVDGVEYPLNKFELLVRDDAATSAAPAPAAVTTVVPMPVPMPVQVVPLYPTYPTYTPPPIYPEPYPVPLPYPVEPYTDYSSPVWRYSERSWRGSGMPFPPQRDPKQPPNLSWNQGNSYERPGGLLPPPHLQLNQPPNLNTNRGNSPMPIGQGMTFPKPLPTDQGMGIPNPMPTPAPNGQGMGMPLPPNLVPPKQ